MTPTKQFRRVEPPKQHRKIALSTNSINQPRQSASLIDLQWSNKETNLRNFLPVLRNAYAEERCMFPINPGSEEKDS